MKKTREGFAIVMAIGIILVITLIAFYILEYIIPFSRNVKGLENSAKAYYQGVNGIEDALYHIRTNSVGAENNPGFGAASVTYDYDIIASTTRHPELGEGNSDYDSNWGILAPGRPLQIYLPRNLAPVLNSINIYFRVPDFDSNPGTSESFDDATLTDLDIVNWQIAGKTDVLNSRPVSVAFPENRVRKINICSSNAVICSGYRIDTRSGFTLNGTVDQTVSAFYGANCSATDYDCILKFTVINDLLATSGAVGGKKIPYLEYYIDFSTRSVPNPNIRVSASGKSYGYRKDIDITFPQKGLLEAFDFTIFQ